LSDVVGLTFEVQLCIKDLVLIFYIDDVYSTISINVMTLGRCSCCN
jgi:hypothetical protein